MRLRSALVAAALLALPLAAKAQPVAGPYISLGAGMNFLVNEAVQSQRVLNFGSFTGTNPAPRGSAHFIQPGLGTEASVGYGFGNGLRLEFEGFYNYNHVHELTGTRFPTNAGGENEEYGGMFNALFDFDIGTPFVFPYVGVGAGIQETAWHNVHAYSTTLFPQVGENINATGGVNFAYQGILGLSFPVYGVPGMSLTAEYRFIGTSGNNTFGGVAKIGNVQRANLGAVMTNEFANQAMFGIRYVFGVAPPPPPPPPAIVTPAPAPARTYLVFFDWDRADLTDRARQIIAEAAESSRHVQYTRIEVNGYTDRSGTPQYNLRLSMRRAQNVAAELVRDGVPRGSIDIHGYGETHPLVPTAPGVREPQNRRVEIILH